MKPPSRRAVEARYLDIRHAALKKAEELAQPAFAPIQVGLTAIGPAAMDAFRTHWADHAMRRFPWPWMDMLADTRRDDPTRFEVAVWGGRTLCGLALGRTRSMYAGVEYLEGCPAPHHPLKGSVAVIVIGAAMVYATALGKPQLRLIHPLPDMVPRYRMLGFELAAPKGEAPYCWRRVR